MVDIKKSLNSDSENSTPVEIFKRTRSSLKDLYDNCDIIITDDKNILLTTFSKSEPNLKFI